MRRSTWWIAGGIAVVAAIVLVITFSNGDPTASAPSREGAGREPGPPPSADEESGEDEPIAPEPGLCRVVDSRGIPLRGRGRNPDVGDLEGEGGYIVWIEGVEDGSAQAVEPNPRGEFIPPPSPAARTVRLIAQDPSRPLELAFGRRIWMLGELSGATVVMEPGEPLPVTVRCEDTEGRGLAARVRIELRLGSRESMTIAHLSIDRSGTRSTRVPGPGRYRAVLDRVESRSARPAEPVMKDFVARRESEAACTFVLQKASSLVVTVRSGEGGPLPGALVALKFQDDGAWRSHPKSGFSDASGRFEFTGLAPGEHFLRVTAAGRAPEIATVSLSAGERLERAVSLAEGGARISGRFVASKGGTRPGAGWSIFFLRHGATPEAVYATHTCRIDEDGAFSGSGIGPGLYEIVVYKGRTELSILADVRESVVDLGRIDMDEVFRKGDRTVSISVRCEDPRNIGFKVLYREASWPTDLWRSTTVSGAAGPTQLEGLVPGLYEFRLSPAGVDPSKYDLGCRVEARVRRDGDDSVKVSLTIPLLK